MDSGVSAARANLSRVWLALFCAGGCGVGAQLGLMLLAQRYAAALAAQSWFLYALMLAQYAVTAALMYLLLRPLGVELAAMPGRFEIKEIVSLLPVCMLASYIMSLVGTAVASAFSALLGRGWSNPVEQAVSGQPASLVLLVMVVIAPLSEEYIFRHLLLDALRPYGDKLAILLSSLAFGLFHFNFTQFFYAFAVGLILSYVAVRTKGISESCALHMLINLLGSLVIPALYERSPQLASGVVSALCAAGVAVAWLLKSRLLFAPASAPLERELRAGDVFANIGFFSFMALSSVMFTLSALAG